MNIEFLRGVAPAALKFELQAQLPYLLLLQTTVMPAAPWPLSCQIQAMHGCFDGGGAKPRDTDGQWPFPVHYLSVAASRAGQCHVFEDLQNCQSLCVGRQSLMLPRSRQSTQCMPSVHWPEFSSRKRLHTQRQTGCVRAVQAGTRGSGATRLHGGVCSNVFRVGTAQGYAEHVQEFKTSAGLTEVSVGYLLAGDLGAGPKSPQHGLLKHGRLDLKEERKLRKCQQVLSHCCRSHASGSSLTSYGCHDFQCLRECVKPVWGTP